MYRGDIRKLAQEFEEESYKFEVDYLDQGYRLKVPAKGKNVRAGYTNVMHSYSGCYNSRALTCVSVTIVDSLQKNNPTALARLLQLHELTTQYHDGHYQYKPVNKEYYDLNLVRSIIKSLKKDYMVSSQKKSFTKKVSALGRTLNKGSVEQNIKQGYNKDWWPFIQDQARLSANMKCACCGVDFKIDKGEGYKCDISGQGFDECFPLYHVHHKDRNKKNDNPENLEALCATCHSFKEGKGHAYFRNGALRPRGRFKEYFSYMLHHRILNQMRRRQGIDTMFDFDFETLQRKSKPRDVEPLKNDIISQQNSLITKQKSLIDRLFSAIKKMTS